MNYCTIYKADIMNGIGLRVSLFVSGCSHHCPGCFNQKAWNEDYGKPYTQETENQIMQLQKNPYVKGLSQLGGEPMEVSHQSDILKLVTRVRKELQDKDIWQYSGYTYEQLTQCGEVATPEANAILTAVDVLVDGEYVQDLKDTELAFRGSSNQRIIDMNATRKNRHLTVYYKHWKPDKTA